MYLHGDRLTAKDRLGKGKKPNRETVRNIVLVLILIVCFVIVAYLDQKTLMLGL